jgi:hypothetical protein
MQTRDPDPGWKAWIIFLRAEKPFFFVKILKFFDMHPGSRTRDGKNSNLGSWDPGRKKFGSSILDLGWETFGFGIQDLG